MNLNDRAREFLQKKKKEKKKNEKEKKMCPILTGFQKNMTKR